LAAAQYNKKVCPDRAAAIDAETERLEIGLAAGGMAVSGARRGVALLAFYFPPENTSGVQRALRMYRYLPEFGYQTHVVCSSHAGQVQMDRVRHVPANGADPETAARAEWARRLQRSLLPYDERLPWVPHAVAAAGQWIRDGAISAVISTSPPTAPHLAAWRLKRKYGVRWIADFRDPILGNPGRSRRWAQPYDKFLERLILAGADRVTAVTDAIAARWRREHPRHAHKIEVIWNGFDPADGFGPQPLPPRARRVLLHSGVLYYQRHPLALLDSLERIIARGLADPSSLVLRFTGIIQGREELLGRPSVQALAARGCLEMPGVNVPRQQAMQEIASSDWLLLIDIVNDQGAGYTVPAKIFDYILTGRPILAITDRNSPVENILNGSGVPVTALYHSDTDAEIDEKLARFLRLPSEPAVAPSEWFLERFDGRRQAGQMARLLASLGV